MRADRLVSLVLLLRQRGQLTTAATLARELEVTPRTVLRDIEALSAAGVPVYSERGRNGGFALLPGFDTELSGLSHDEALALLVAGSRRGEQVFGLGSALSSAVRKVVDALPESHRATVSDAARRLLIDPDADMIMHRPAIKEPVGEVMSEVRSAVLTGRKLCLRYGGREQTPQWRVLDPVGLVTVQGRGYLLALRSGEERTYRLSRIQEARALDEPAERPERVDLDRVWRARCAEFLHGGDQVTARVVVASARREELVSTALAVRADEFDADGQLQLEVTWQDAEHAEFALWRLGSDAEALEPDWLRATLRDRGAEVAAHYATVHDHVLS
ncbi:MULTISPECIES: helix-turn-helix transcriptional regulator [Dermacoccus]|uniref:WYL domain-containing protein n=2 Tax=Dermacoccus TaxID=57495 RepID=A0A417Z131_9MICO|nr:WYL domain-containing protein [Dermacoccus abyssi]RHW43999.1 WYL domain-containing protein [Dermacoccus abyssi]